MNKNIKLAVAGAVLAMSASAANAGIVIPAGEWTLDINGNVNAFQFGIKLTIQILLLVALHQQKMQLVKKTLKVLIQVFYHLGLVSQVRLVKMI